MGFTTGFVGGFTLVSSVLYLSLAAHKRNRLYQSAMLRQEAFVLNNIAEPSYPPVPPKYQASRSSLVESAKDRWNAEIEGLAKRLQAVKWTEVRESVEDKVAGLWIKPLERVEASGSAS